MQGQLEVFFLLFWGIFLDVECTDQINGCTYELGPGLSVELGLVMLSLNFTQTGPKPKPSQSIRSLSINIGW